MEAEVLDERATIRTRIKLSREILLSIRITNFIEIRLLVLKIKYSDTQRIQNLPTNVCVVYFVQTRHSTQIAEIRFECILM
jgi:hypothetical protein